MGAAIGQANEVIIVTPEYNYLVPGVLKKALDWLSRLPMQRAAGKQRRSRRSHPDGSAARGAVLPAAKRGFLDAAVLNKPEVMSARL